MGKLSFKKIDFNYLINKKIEILLADKTISCLIISIDKKELRISLPLGTVLDLNKKNMSLRCAYKFGYFLIDANILEYQNNNIVLQSPYFVKYNQRRNYLRANCNINAEIDGFTHSTIKNISAGGAMIFVPSDKIENIKNKDQIILNFKIKQKEIILRAKILSYNNNIIRVKFIDTPKEIRQIIDYYCSYLDIKNYRKRMDDRNDR